MYIVPRVSVDRVHLLNALSHQGHFGLQMSKFVLVTLTTLYIAAYLLGINVAPAPICIKWTKQSFDAAEPFVNFSYWNLYQSYTCDYLVNVGFFLPRISSEWLEHNRSYHCRVTYVPSFHWWGVSHDHGALQSMLFSPPQLLVPLCLNGAWAAYHEAHLKTPSVSSRQRTISLNAWILLCFYPWKFGILSSLLFGGSTSKPLIPFTLLVRMGGVPGMAYERLGYGAGGLHGNTEMRIDRHVISCNGHIECTELDQRLFLIWDTCTLYVVPVLHKTFSVLLAFRWSPC